MPEIQIEIGGRPFQVSCQPGEEAFLQSAAKLLDTEAAVVLGQIGRMPTDRMLLMAGLMLADKTAGLEDDLKKAEADLRAGAEVLAAAEERLSRRAARIAELEERVQTAPASTPAAAIIPASVGQGLGALAERVEALADRLERDDEADEG